MKAVSFALAVTEVAKLRKRDHRKTDIIITLQFH